MNVRSDLPATEGGRVVAVLGPTNTGKTYLAIERMLGHRTGMIGFPLRLLARENYERIVAIKGKAVVALVTGEEKILPAHPSYWVCTVESMPLDRVVDFLAVDEIQLCADPERGHIFTDRLLHARGQVETMVLGSETVQPLIRRLVPRAEFVTRPRFSKLTYAGSRRLTRLPPRSAIVAFSATDVYALAETLRRQRGGTAVVLGALSPRTRNAQVGLYQSGEVDYLVATDAIGMGLNMDVDHVAFARMTKFDGFAPRRLKAPEVAQIAGRAGRHTRDGTFGTTEDVGELDEELIERVENHEFDKLTHVMWRNSELRFDTVGFLLKSLEARPAMPELIRVREADDHLALQVLARDPDVAPLARGIAAVRQLWEVCQVPDFRKVLSDAHTRLLSRIFQHLMTGGHRLPTDWVAQQVANLDHVEGDIDALVARIAHVRTWTYISNRPNWLIDPGHWQERTRAIEDKLSDALHERLTQRFVDRRSAMLTRTLRSGRDLIGGVKEDGEVVVEGHPVGRIEGFRFIPDAPARSEEARALLTAARRALRDEIARRLKNLEEEGDAAFALGPDGTLTWNALPVARLAAGEGVLSPAVVANDEALLDQPQRDRVRQRLERWVRDRIATRLKPLFALRDIAGASGAARGLAFQLAEGLGFLRRGPVEEMIRALTGEDRKILSRHGVRIAPGHVHMPVLAKPAAVELRALLWAVHAGAALPPPVPAGGRVSIPADAALPPAYWDAIGYPLAGPRAIRADMLDRFETGIAAIKNGAPEAFHTLGRPLGCSADEVDAVLAALGYRRAVSAEGAVTWRRRKHRSASARRPAVPVAADHPFAQLLRLTGTP